MEALPGESPPTASNQPIEDGAGPEKLRTARTLHTSDNRNLQEEINRKQKKYNNVQMNTTPALTRSKFLEVYDKYVRDGTYVEAKKNVDAVSDPSRGYAYNRQKEQGIIHKFIQEMVPEQIRNLVVYAAFLIAGKPEDYFSREFGVIPTIGHFGLPQESRRMLGGIAEGSDLFLCPKAALLDVLDKAKDVIGEHFVYLSMNSLLRSTIPDDILDTSEYQRAFYCVSERSSDIALDLK